MKRSGVIVLCLSCCPTVTLGFGLTSAGWNGELGWSYRTNFLNENTSSTVENIRLGFVANGYLSQPWIATFGSTLNWSETVSEGDINDSRSENIAGTLGLNVFPQSRFPFDAYASRDSQEIETDAQGLTLNAQREERSEYGFSQLYRSLDGKFTTKASYSVNEFGLAAAEKNSVTEADADAVWNGRFSLSVGQADAESPGSGTNTQTKFGLVSATFLTSKALTLSGTVRFDSASVDSESAPSVESSIGEMDLNWNGQFNDDKASYNGRFNILDQESVVGRGKQSSRVSLIENSLDYRFNKQWNGFAQIELSQTDADDEDSTSNSESIGLSWNGPGVGGDQLRYQMSAQMSASRRESGAAQSSTQENFNHGVSSRTFSDDATKSVMWSLSQDLGSEQSTEDQPSFSAQHTASWTTSVLHRNVTTSWTTSVVDSRQLAEESLVVSDNITMTASRVATGVAGAGYSLLGTLTYGNTQQEKTVADIANIDRTEALTLTLQASRTDALTAFQSLDSNASFSASDAETDVNRNRNRSLNMSVAYRHLRLFGIPNLGLTSSFEWEKEGIAGATDEEEGFMAWDSALSYRIGRLTVDSGLKFLDRQGEEIEGQFFVTVKRFLGNI